MEISTPLRNIIPFDAPRKDAWNDVKTRLSPYIDLQTECTKEAASSKKVFDLRRLGIQLINLNGQIIAKNGNHRLAALWDCFREANPDIEVIGEEFTPTQKEADQYGYQLQRVRRDFGLNNFDDYLRMIEEDNYPYDLDDHF